MNTATDDLGLKFSKPKIVMTKFGEREVYSSPATEEFWAAWRERKDALKAEGWSVSKGDKGEWRVSIWRETVAKEVRAAAVQASKAEDAKINVPVPVGMALLPYQRGGVAYAVARPGTLIADEMGLGKTVQAIGVANVTGAKRILIVCPASLLGNWKNEIGRWQTLGHPVHIVRAGAKWPANIKTGFVIVNYDIVSRYPAIKTESWDLMVVDEAHYLKNREAKRTKWILGARANTRKKQEAIEPISAERTLLLTGTPITNRPAEIFTLIHRLDPKRWTSFTNFAKRYCGAVFDGYGLQMGEPTNLDELQMRLRETVMVRRIKADVLTELPAKRRQIVLVDVDGASSLVAAERKIEEETEAAVAQASYAAQKAEAEGSETEYTDAVAKLQAARKIAFTEMARVRHETAVAKIPAIIEHLENTDGKIVVFAHHKTVVSKLMDALGPYGAVSITGETPNERRQEIVEQFQTNPDIRFFVGNMQAAGVGITLTASSHVVFAELDWVPATLSQAEDRTHRIGQRASVLVQHLVIDGSIDARMAETVVKKQEMIDKALDDDVEEISYPIYSPAIAPAAPPAASNVKTTKPTAVPIELTQAQVIAIHGALRTVAGLDLDGARALNGIGFSKIDTMFGRELAERHRLSSRQAAVAYKMIRKYRRQYSPDLYQQIYGAETT